MRGLRAQSTVPASLTGGVARVFKPGRRARRRAFTLAELVVSIGVLVLMIGMAGTVFSLTLRSTGQATALVTLSQRLRMLERELTDDLGNVRRGASKMVIVAHEVNAYWTADQRELDADGDPLTGRFARGGDPERMYWDAAAGEILLQPPRADTLMFFTARPGTSYLDPGVRSNLQMVVYGHAELGELDAGTGTWRADPVPFDSAYLSQTSPDRFPLPASDWHLARRSVLVTNWDPGGAVTSLTDPDQLPLLVSGRADVLVSDCNAGGFCYDGDVATGTDPYPVPEGWYERSELDLSPPVALANRLAAYLLPNCASFKVEWALPLSRLPDPDGVLRGLPTVWVDPYRSPAQLADSDDEPDWVHLLNARWNVVAARYLNNFATYGAWQSFVDNVTQPLPDGRFRGKTTHEWLPEIPPPYPAGTVPGDPDPYFPTALRITVDVYDDAGRLERPIRHVMVIPVGT